jgi:hypothetical protein
MAQTNSDGAGRFGSSGSRCRRQKDVEAFDQASQLRAIPAGGMADHMGLAALAEGDDLAAPRVDEDTVPGGVEMRREPMPALAARASGALVSCPCLADFPLKAL